MAGAATNKRGGVAAFGVAVLHFALLNSYCVDAAERIVGPTVRGSLLRRRDALASKASKTNSTPTFGPTNAPTLSNSSTAPTGAPTFAPIHAHTVCLSSICRVVLFSAAGVTLIVVLGGCAFLMALFINSKKANPRRCMREREVDPRTRALLQAEGAEDAVTAARERISDRRRNRLGNEASARRIGAPSAGGPSRATPLRGGLFVDVKESDMRQDLGVAVISPRSSFLRMSPRSSLSSLRPPISPRGSLPPPQVLPPTPERPEEEMMIDPFGNDGTLQHIDSFDP